MIVTVYTLFPGLIRDYLQDAILARAQARGAIDVRPRDLRRFAGNRSGRVDDAPYGGGAGMVVRVDVAAAALEEAARSDPPPDRTVLLSPAGTPLTQDLVARLATDRHLCLLAGRYEGFDARVERRVDLEVSVGDFVLMGGELPALCLIEAVARLLPGVLGDEESYRQDSFGGGLLDYPEYTRPATFEGDEVPAVLKSGDHGRVARWRREQALRRTRARRPDLLAHADLTPDDHAFLATLEPEHAPGVDAPETDEDGRDP